MDITSRLTRALLIPAALFVAIFCMTLQAHSEEAIKTDLNASEIRDFTGAWALKMDMMGRIMEFKLTIVDLGGKAGATFDSARQAEPTAVEEMILLEEGALQLTYDMKFGAQTFSLIVTANLSDDGLEGQIVESGGLFKAPFTAVEAVDDVETRDQRRRNRRISATSATLRFERDKVVISFSALATKSKDYENFQSLSNDTVFEYVGGRASKILTDVDLHFGDTVVKQGNAYVTYPGVYSIWLKKTAKGYSLVFNEEADVWGTMFNPDTQAYEVPLTETKVEEASDKMKVTLEKLDDNTGTLNVFWADKKYSVNFTKGEKRSESPS